MVRFRRQLDAVLRTSKGERVLDEAMRLARDPVSRRRIEELRRKVLAETTGARAGAGSTPARD